MYTTKIFNVNSEINNGRYISINDPYVDSKDVRPERWKQRQFQVPQEPENAGDGYFGYNQKAFSYSGGAYQEQHPYVKTQPLDKRKLGFGTHDASRRDEFAQTIRTEQYRDTLRKEARKNKGMKSDPAALEAALAKEAQFPRKFCSGKREITHLYDVGRNVITPFDVKNSRDQFYSLKESYHSDKRLGGHRTASQEIGADAWSCKYEHPQHSAKSGIKNFYDRSHLGTN